MVLKVKAEKRQPLSRNVARPSSKKDKRVLPEAHDARERAKWQKEKRVYWSSRFRRILAEIAVKPKAKKVGTL